MGFWEDTMKENMADGDGCDVDIVVAWIKSEMRLMLDEEIAHAILVGDDEFKIKEDNIYSELCKKAEHELFAIAAEFIRPHLPDSVKIDVDGRLSYSYTESPMFYSPMTLAYDALRDFIKHMVSYGRSFNEYEKRRLVKIFNTAKEPRDYDIVLRIIFLMIKRGYLKKREVVDAVSTTENIPALVELIKYDDYSVFDERKLEL